MEEENPQVESPQSESAPVEDKTIGIIAYITVIGLIIAIIMNQEKKNAFGSYHIRQSLGLFATGIVLALINVIPILGQLIFLVVSLCIFIFAIIGIMNAVNGKEKPLPILGEKYAEWFKGVS